MENREWIVLIWWFMWLFQCTIPADVQQEYKTALFETRSFEEWKNHWHDEKYRRCYHQIPSHIKLACEKDIYRVEKKNPMLRAFEKPDQYLPIDLVYGFGTKKRSRRQKQKRQASGIIEECCEKPMGCSWEEYAEYCPGHNRRRNSNLFLTDN
ncbi:probable insulin-like peptide 7 isoform X1 [Centruroides sculpturatus]|uniref:probable insulin-like peptide 7 isoform X1 n=1 Tax=Centruroides sculpturatus TaxID=218467 RepID=UPI000C6D3126|nr:probable insulin-like peptide 7 isoform X1 [Centruroides sculpturatus]